MNEGSADTPEQVSSPRPRMTLSVYTVHRDGTRTPRGPRRNVAAGDPERLAEPLGYPPCTCPNCNSTATR